MTHPALVPGNVAVITGGASGIGLGVASLLAERGLRVVNTRVVLSPEVGPATRRRAPKVR